MDKRSSYLVASFNTTTPFAELHFGWPNHVDQGQCLAECFVLHASVIFDPRQRSPAVCWASRLSNRPGNGAVTVQYHQWNQTNGLHPNSKRNLIALASNLIAMASDLLAMASNLLAMAFNLEAMGSNPIGWQFTTRDDFFCFLLCRGVLDPTTSCQVQKLGNQSSLGL